MLLQLKLLPIILAGLMNGSFVIPARYVKNILNEKIWFYHSIIGLAIIPWLLLALILPGIVHNYLSLSTSVMLFLVFSGAVFGLGQVFFAYAIESIGIALSFMINIGIGLTIGSMFVVFYKGDFFTLQGGLVTLAVILILSSLFIHYCSGKYNNTKNINTQKNANYRQGWLLASLTGLTSGLQNITFVIVAFHSATQFNTSDSYWVWPPFLLAAAIPMLLGFLYRVKTHQTYKTSQATKLHSVKNFILIFLMGLFFTGSLALYSDGMSKLDHHQQVVGWPAFMLVIIFTCQLWGWLHRESANTSIKSRVGMLISMLLLIIAIIILAIEIS